MRDMISLRCSGGKTSAIPPRTRLAVQLLPPAGMRRLAILDRNEYTSDPFSRGCSVQPSPADEVCLGQRVLGGPADRAIRKIEGGILGRES